MGAEIGRWWRSVIFAGAAVAVVGVMQQDGYLTLGVFIAVGLLAAAVLVAPRRRPPSATNAEAQERARREGLLIGYWRPGCPYCERLRTALRGEEGIVWVDIWQDPDAAEVVREVNDGHELVPTVIAGDAVWPNPGTEKVRSALRSLHVA